MDKTVTIIEDEISLAKILAYDLKKSDFEVVVFHDGEIAAQAIPTQPTNFYIVDWMLPHRSGIELVAIIRRHFPHAYIVMTTAKDDELSVIEGLESGADHYMTKPVSHRELIAHLQAFIRRQSTQLQATPEFKPTLKIDSEKRIASLHDQVLNLTKIEFDLLNLFTQHPQKVFTRDYLLNTIWGFNYDGSSRIVDVHVSNLRLKLPKEAGQIISIRGIGYRYEPSV